MERYLFLWILIGLVLGAGVKLLLPGREPGGFVAALLLGLAGALGGGFLLLSLGGGRVDLMTGAFAAAAGALLLIAFYRLVMRTRTR